jgi:hypothetical protein
LTKRRYLCTISDAMSTRRPPNNGRKAELVVAALRQTSVMRSRDLVTLGVSREYLRKLCDRGKVERVGRGLVRPQGGILARIRSLQTRTIAAQGCSPDALQIG